MQMAIPMAVAGPSNVTGPIPSEPVALDEGKQEAKGFAVILNSVHAPSEQEGARTQHAGSITQTSTETDVKSPETTTAVSLSEKPVPQDSREGTETQCLHPQDLMDRLPVDWVALLLGQQASSSPEVAPSHEETRKEESIQSIEVVPLTEEPPEDQQEESAALSIAPTESDHQAIALPIGMAAAFLPSEPAQFAVIDELDVEIALRPAIQISVAEGRRDVQSNEMTKLAADGTADFLSRTSAIVTDKMPTVPRQQITDMPDPLTFKMGMEPPEMDQPAAGIGEMAELAVRARQESPLRDRVNESLSDLSDVFRAESEGPVVTLVEQTTALYPEGGLGEGEPEQNPTSDFDGQSQFHQESSAPMVGSTNVATQIDAVGRRDGAGSPAPIQFSMSQSNGGIRALQEQEEAGRLPTTPALTVEVNQPDLGLVRVRVAQSDRTIHAHVVTDQAEVGRFLTAHEDRLDATFQASGLDLGQFHVQVGTQGQHEGRQRGGSTAAHDPGQEQRRPEASSKEFDRTEERERSGREARILSILA